MEEYDTCTQGQTNPLTVVDLDPVYGQPALQIRAAGVQSGNGIVYCYGNGYDAPQIAIRGDGAVIISEPSNNGFPPLTMAQNGGTASYGIPPSSITTNGVTIYPQCCMGPPMVNVDGTVYVEYEVRNVVNDVITSDTLYLQQIDLNNNWPHTVLSTTTQNQALLPGRIIPDGQGGILATWTISPSNPPVPQYPYQAVDVVGGVVGTPYNLPFSPTTVAFGQSPTLVLGENGAVFATDGTDTVNGPVVSSFSVASGALNWSYQTTMQNTLSIVASTSGNGLVAKTTDQNANDTLIWFDPTGATTTDTWSASSVQYGENEWLGFSGAASASSITVFSDAPVLWADSVWLMPQQAGTSASEPPFTLRGVSDCEGPTGRSIEYWLVATQGGALVTQPYIVFEQQTDHTLAPPNGVSPLNYSGEQDKFDDSLSPNADPNPHTSTQTFNFGMAGQRLYPVRRIDRTLANSHVPVSPPQFSIVILPGQQATLNGKAAPYVGPCSGNYPPN